MISRPLLTASLIVKNEEKCLGACLASLRGVADEVIIVDTGSTDRTREIAESAGARVYDFTWTGDFSEARNRALDLSSGKWILYIDADERVRPESVSNLQIELSDPGRAGYEVLLYPRPGHTPFWIMRLFRNDPAVRFRGIIHENIWPELYEYGARQGLGFGKSALALDHEGYEGNLAAKNVRNLPMLLRALQQDPQHIYCWCHLATIRMEMKEPERAKEAWLTALRLVRERDAHAPEDILPYLGLIQHSADFGCDADSLLAEASAQFPSSVHLEWIRARKLMDAGRFEDAIAGFLHVIERGESRDYEHIVAHDPKYFGVFTYDCIATCHFRLGQYSQSRHYYDLAARQAPDQAEYRVKRALCERLERRPAGSPADT